ncbi:MAG: mechanosensitive ion channel [Bacteroidota bacterium]
MDQFNESINNLFDKLKGWLNDFIVALPNMVIAFLVVVIGFYLTRRLRKYVYRLMGRITNHESLRNLATTIATVVFYAIILILALSVLNLSKALTSILAGAGVAGLAIGLALQDPILNLFSGIMMATRSAFKLGDLVETNDYFGTITKISLRSTHLRTYSGQEVIIPNKIVYQNPIKNYNLNHERRIEVSCGVSYGDNLERVQQIALDAIRENVDYNQEKELQFFYTEFGSSSINFVLRIWVKNIDQAKYLATQSAAIIALKQAFDAQDIAIPFPIRTLDFGVKGGEKLAEAWPDLTAIN